MLGKRHAQPNVDKDGERELSTAHRKLEKAAVPEAAAEAMAAATAACSLKRTRAFDVPQPVALVHHLDAIYGRAPPDRAVPRSTEEQKARASRAFPQPTHLIRGLILTVHEPGPADQHSPAARVI